MYLAQFTAQPEVLAGLQSVTFSGLESHLQGIWEQHLPHCGEGSGQC